LFDLGPELAEPDVEGRELNLRIQIPRSPRDRLPSPPAAPLTAPDPPVRSGSGPRLTQPLSLPEDFQRRLSTNLRGIYDIAAATASDLRSARNTVRARAPVDPRFQQWIWDDLHELDQAMAAIEPSLGVLEPGRLRDLWETAREAVAHAIANF